MKPDSVKLKKRDKVMICLAATNPESSRMNEIFQQVHSLIEIFSWPLWCDQEGGPIGLQWEVQHMCIAVF